jgi:hypothetical protein
MQTSKQTAVKKVELKSIKHVKSRSFETECFDAVIYIDGRSCGGVHNDGCGGSHYYDDRGVEAKLDGIYAEANPAEEMSYPGMGAEMLVGDLLSDHLIRADIKRLMSTTLLFERLDGTVGNTTRIDAAKRARALANPAPVLAALKGKRLILDLDEAVAMLRKEEAADSEKVEASKVQRAPAAYTHVAEMGAAYWIDADGYLHYASEKTDGSFDFDNANTVSDTAFIDEEMARFRKVMATHGMVGFKLSEV